MARRKSRANYNSNPNYLDYLTALRKFFTNDADIIPIIMAFNFYINGVYGIPYTDLFRQYQDSYQDIHGDEKTKALTDDGTIGVINEQIFEQGGGSLITSLEALRIYLEDRQRTYTIAYNPFVNAYAEYKIAPINDLGTSNPVVTTNGIDPNAAPVVINETFAKEDVVKDKVESAPIESQLPIETKTTNAVHELVEAKHRKSFWQHLGFLSYKNSARYKKQQGSILKNNDYTTA